MKQKIKQRKKEKLSKATGKAFKALFVGEKVFSNSKEAFTLYDTSRFGEPKEGKIYYSIVEAVYLAEKGKIEVYIRTKKLTLNKLMEKAKDTEKNFHTRFAVFRDMRNRGYIVKTALKFGADFRVYDRGVKPGEDHAKWILYPVYESSGLTWHEFAAKNRVAHSTKKNLLIGIVDDEGDVTYYQIAWIRP
ncbi:tRNA-intron lyase [Candidatus Pacearchaeota archaeon]|nr:tRNA-intron lyase [Candidatus Pacearchaeota archaeon]